MSRSFSLNHNINGLSFPRFLSSDLSYKDTGEGGHETQIILVQRLSEAADYRVIPVSSRKFCTCFQNCQKSLSTTNIALSGN